MTTSTQAGSVTTVADVGAPALEIDGLSVRLDRSLVLDGVSLTVASGETLALVGESGAGKSMTSRAVMGLLPPVAHVTTGTVRVNGRTVIQPGQDDSHQLRGSEIAMIFQNPLRSLNPTMKVGAQVVEAVRARASVSRPEARARALDLLARVQIPDVRRRFNEYPHQLSGGMRQRVVIAMALSCRPSLLIADEPTTALDVSTQHQIIELLRELQQELGMAMLFITHDMRVALDIAHRTAVMYAGRVVEEGPTLDVVERSRMRYTKALLDSIPTSWLPRHSVLPVIAGRPPDLASLPPGCAFEPRCTVATAQCSSAVPPECVDATDSAGHRWRCWHPIEVVGR